MTTEDVRIRSDTLVYDGVTKVREVYYDAPRYSGGTLENISRQIVVRHDSAAALVHDTERDRIILCYQLRISGRLAGTSGWLVELPAGKIEDGEAPAVCIRRELREELGIRADTLDPLGVMYTAPGYSTERVHLFYAPITAKDFVDNAAHGVDCGEDVRRVDLDMVEFLERLRTMSFLDVKIAAIGAYALGRFGRAGSADLRQLD